MDLKLDSDVTLLESSKLFQSPIVFGKRELYTFAFFVLTVLSTTYQEYYISSFSVSILGPLHLKLYNMRSRAICLLGLKEPPKNCLCIST